MEMLKDILAGLYVLALMGLVAVVPVAITRLFVDSWETAFFGILTIPVLTLAGLFGNMARNR